MPDETSPPRPIVIVALVLAVAAASGMAWPHAARSGQTEFIRETVEKPCPGTLVLTDVKLQDGADAGRPVMVIVNEDAACFDGAVKTTRESVTNGLKVLVKCEPAGTGRVVVLVRIVGG